MASGAVVRTRPNIGFAFETLTVADSIQVLTPGTYKDNATSGGADSAFITLATAQIRYRYDGGDPSSTVGHILDTGGILILNGQNQMSNFKAIRTGGSSGVLSVTYERE